MSRRRTVPHLRLSDTAAELEAALADMQGVADLLAALASSAILIQPGALFPVVDAVESLQARARAAFDALCPVPQHGAAAASDA